MKNRCYPKYSYIIFIFLSIVLFVFSIAPAFIGEKEDVLFKVIWSASMFVIGVFCAIGAIHNMQYFYFESDYIIIKSLFGEIVKLNIKTVQAYIERLPTYSSWVTSINEEWICIYDEKISDCCLHKFKSGCSNKKKHKRVQIFFTENNKKIIEHYIKINTRKIL